MSRGSIHKPQPLFWIADRRRRLEKEIGHGICPFDSAAIRHIKRWLKIAVALLNVNGPSALFVAKQAPRSLLCQPRQTDEQVKEAVDLQTDDNADSDEVGRRPSFMVH
jgi:hypothetical protein